MKTRYILIMIVFVLAICSMANESVSDVLEAGGIRMVAIPEKKVVKSGGKLGIMVYIVNDTGKDFDLRISGFSINGKAIFSRFIGGEIYTKDHKSLVPVGSKSDHRGGFENKVAIRIPKHSSYEIKQDFDFTPFPDIVAKKSKLIGVFFVRFYIDGLEVNTNDFMVLND